MKRLTLVLCAFLIFLESCNGAPLLTPKPSFSLSVEKSSDYAPAEIDVSISVNNGSLENVSDPEWCFDCEEFQPEEALSGLTTVSKLIDSSGEHTVWCRFKYEGSVRSIRTTFSLEEKLTVSLSASTTQGYSPLSVDFTANTTSPVGVVEYQWDYDYDGTNFTEDEKTSENAVTHTFYKAGTYTVAVKAVDRDGYWKLATIEVQVLGRDRVHAELKADPTNGTPPLVVTFSAADSYCVGCEITQYQWDYDYDSSFSADETTTWPVVQHTYSESGTHVAAVKIVGSSGEEKIATVKVNVGDVPQGTITASRTSGTVPLRVTFMVNSPDAVFYEWDVGYDDAEGFVPDYAGENLYQLTVTLTDADQNVIAARITGPSGLMTVLTLELTLNKPPTASLSSDFEPTVTTVPLTLTFDASQSQDDDGKISKYEWDFDYKDEDNADGDDDPFTGEDFTVDAVEYSGKISYLFQRGGKREVAVKVVDDAGGYSIAKLNFVLNDPPIASLQCTPPVGDAPLQVSCDASASYDPNGDSLTYEWDYDYDGTSFTVNETTTTPSVLHSFTAPGNYVIAVRVSDGKGGYSIATFVITVN